jgi:hypothetical protein
MEPKNFLIIIPDEHDPWLPINTGIKFDAAKADAGHLLGADVAGDGFNVARRFVWGGHTLSIMGHV